MIWSISCNDFYSYIANLELINWANIILLPKSHQPITLTVFRHISLINFSLKIIFKIMATRLAMVIVIW